MRGHGKRGYWWDGKPGEDNQVPNRPRELQKVHFQQGSCLALLSCSFLHQDCSLLSQGGS